VHPWIGTQVTDNHGRFLMSGIDHGRDESQPRGKQSQNKNQPRKNGGPLSTTEKPDRFSHLLDGCQPS
jgi:hypothetical protein